MNEPMNDTEQLQARVEMLEAREQKRAKRTRLLMALGVISVLASPFAVRALGAVPHVFGTGDRIVASEINENFAHVVGGVTAVETRTAALEARSAVRTVYASFGGATVDGSACATSPCAIWRQSGDVETATRLGPGEYAVTFAAGTFSGIPTCSCVGISPGGTESRFCTINPATRSLVSVGRVLIRDPAAIGVDGNVDLVCVGPR